MEQIKDVISIGRGIGAWGDMVITSGNDEKVELRSLPNFKELEGEIQRMTARSRSRAHRARARATHHHLRPREKEREDECY